MKGGGLGYGDVGVEEWSKVDGWKDGWMRLGMRVVGLGWGGGVFWKRSWLL